MSLTRYIAGANNGYGFNGFGSGVFDGFQSWNNRGNGLVNNGTVVSGGQVLSNFNVYHNGGNGIVDQGPYGLTMTGGISRGNGSNTGNNEKYNYEITSACENWHISNCKSYAIYQDGTALSKVGFRINNATHAGVFTGNRDEGATEQAVSMANYSNVLPNQVGDQVSVTTSGVGLFNVAVDGAMWRVFVAHTGGNAAATAVVRGDSGTPGIVSQDSNGNTVSGGTHGYTFSISGSNLRVASDVSALTSNWRVERVI